MNELLTDHEDIALQPQTLHNDTHFLRAIAQMAQTEEVVSRQAIYAENGIKLVEQGARVDSNLYGRLLQHRLKTSIDEQLIAQSMVDITTLEAQVMRLCNGNLLGQHLVHHLDGQQYMLLEVLRYMAWPQSASFKMTVMRSQQPQLFEHSVLVMMVAVFLACKQGMSPQECGHAAAAGLLHDVGMLFMPPNWTDPQHRLTSEERKQLEVHSITGMLAVRAAKAFPKRVEEAVLEHHERLDGSGYPRHLKGDEISPMGRILMLAEVVAAFYGKFNDMPAQRLSLVLRMNARCFDPVLLGHVHAMLSKEAYAPLSPSGHDSTQVRQVIATLGAVFHHWSQCKRKLPEKWQTMVGGRAGVYVDARLNALEKTLAESGSHPRQQADWLTMFEEEPSSMTELVLINREALWQIDRCVENMLRRWPQLLQPRNPVEENIADWLQGCRRVLLQAA